MKWCYIKEFTATPSELGMYVGTKLYSNTSNDEDGCLDFPLLTS